MLSVHMLKIWRQMFDEGGRHTAMYRVCSMRVSFFVGVLFFTQILLPTVAVQAFISPSLDMDSDADIDTLALLNIHPRASAEFGWSTTSNVDEVVGFLYRDSTPLSPSQYSVVTGTSMVSGYHILTHTYPVPTEWVGQLSDKGIDCFSFLPRSSFHCYVPDLTISELSQLDVIGISKMDPTDKIRTNLARGLTGQSMYAYNPYVSIGEAYINVVLSGTELPSGIESNDDVTVMSHSTRFSTMFANADGIKWLVEHDDIEWVEEKPYYILLNSEATEVMKVNDVWSSTNMAAIDSNWIGLDGSGVIVTVADTGLDNGYNNSNMHPDFKDHITGILSWPMSASTCSYYTSQGYTVPSGCADDAEDLHGHGTHVAGSVLGDGTDNTVGIIGSAPEAHLLVHSIATTLSGSESLAGIPDDLDDLFSLAWANGSQVHTNSWGSDVNGLYTTSSMQADASARTHDELVILFAAANEGADANSDGEIDNDSLGSPASAKNVITVGASENNRPTINSVYGSGYGSPISTDKYADNPEGMAAFSSRGPADDNRVKPDISAPGTFILSTKSRSAGNCGWGSYNTSYCYMGGTSMATPLTAGAVALLIQHLDENENYSTPTSALIKAIMTASAHDMEGQYSSGGDGTNGAKESSPNIHEGWGLVNMSSAVNASWIDKESLSTNDDRGWSFSIPANAEDFQILLSWTDPASTTTASVNLVNDLDLAVKDPSGTWTNLSNDRDNLRGLKFSNPAQGTWEVHVLGSNVPTGPQFFALAINADVSFTNLTQDMDNDGVIDTSDDCSSVFGTSTQDRDGCPDTDGDGYSNPDSNWTVNNGADAFPSDSTQWADTDFDGYGDNSAGTNPDACVSTAGNSTTDRFGCTDADGDGYSNPDSTWTTSNGADACETVAGDSYRDRNGCSDTDGDGASDGDSTWTTSNGADAFPSDSSQWEDSDGDGYGDNPPPATDGDACPTTSGSSSQDRFGCTDSDGDGYSDPDSLWTVGQGADAFTSDATQWVDSDGDGYGDNSSGNNPDACPSTSGTSTQLNRLGCPDSDGDGYADIDDEFDNDATQFEDTDGDGYGDNASGNNPDACPTVNATSSVDRNGCLDSDGDGVSDPDASWTVSNGADAFPNDSTQSADSDGDGYGDNPSGTNGDQCPSTSGTSLNDRLGCPDTDGDGYSDPDAGWTASNGADAYPSDPNAWSDNDGDGFSDQNEDDCENVAGTSIHDRVGCLDTDGDGYSDASGSHTVAMGADAFPNDATQWNDTDGDGFGDNPTGNSPDACPTEFGTSWTSQALGCPDEDNDGRANSIDAFPSDNTQWNDTDNDGYGDNPGGSTPDTCPTTPGNSTQGNRYGCPDNDGDGWDDVIDELPDSGTQWLDQDGDGYGDNASGELPDGCPGLVGNSTLDQYGCPDADGDGVSDINDSFPLDPTRSRDSDNDGFDDLEDACPNVLGNSTLDRNGCLDTDGDGYSNPVSGLWNITDGADAFVNDPTQWADSDGDGFGDEANGNAPDSCPSVAGTSTVDVYGCLDNDSDGYSDDGDDFPNESTQWLDSDQDGYGDELDGFQYDSCPSIAGTSTIDQFGCEDGDGDGMSDENDLWPDDASQWMDSDGDGYGDQSNAVDGDTCPTEFGTATSNGMFGCPDADGDSYADSDDAFPDEATQHSDADGDGWGDNDQLGSYKPDHYPNDPSRNSAEGELICSISELKLDIVVETTFTFSCTLNTDTESAFFARIEWQPMSIFVSQSTVQAITFDDTTGNTQTVTFSGTILKTGKANLVLVAREPGSSQPMDTHSIKLEVFNSSIEQDSDGAFSSLLQKGFNNPIGQALLGIGALALLMGLLVKRGSKKNRKIEELRQLKKEEFLRQRHSQSQRMPPRPPQL